MTDRYVGPGGSDGADGLSWANRKLTLNGVEDTPVTAGDTVYVGPGTYRETLDCDVSGSSGNPIEYVADVTGMNTDGIGGRVRITGSDNDDTAVRSNTISNTSATTYRTFRGFLMDGCDSQLINISQGDHWIIEDCVLFKRDWYADSIRYGWMPDGGTLTIRRCLIQGHKPIYVYAIAERTCSVRIENNIFIVSIPYDTDTRGIEFWRPRDWEVVNNTFLMGMGVETEGISAAYSGIVENNIFQHGSLVANADNMDEDYNVYERDVSNPIDTDLTQGSNTVFRPILFQPPLLYRGMKYPWTYPRLSHWSTIPDLACSNNAPSDDFFGVTRPTSDAKKTRGAIQFNQPSRGTEVHLTGESIKMPDAMCHQTLVPTTGKQMTFSVQVYRESNYAGTLPQLIIKQPGQSTRTTTDIGSAGVWNKLSDTFTPASSPKWVMMEIRSDNTAMSGNYAVYFDDLEAK